MNRSEMGNIERLRSHVDIHDLLLILAHFSGKLVLPVVQVLDTFQIGDHGLKFRDFCGGLVEISLVKKACPQPHRMNKRQSNRVPAPSGYSPLSWATCEPAWQPPALSCRAGAAFRQRVTRPVPSSGRLLSSSARGLWRPPHSGLLLPEVGRGGQGELPS